MDIELEIDFTNYAMLDLIDKSLSTLHTKIIKKDLDEAYSVLEALVLFVSMDSGWTCKWFWLL
jgi:hypothetical protein